MDKLYDIHLLPDSMIYSRVMEEELLCTVNLGSGQVKLCDALLKYLYILFTFSKNLATQLELQITS